MKEKNMTVYGLTLQDPDKVVMVEYVNEDGKEDSVEVKSSRLDDAGFSNRELQNPENAGPCLRLDTEDATKLLENE